MYAELYIVRGVPKTDGDTVSAEPSLEVVDLQNPDGFAVQQGGWVPEVAQFSGVFQESTVETQSVLIAGRDQRVTETIQLTVTATSFDELSLKLSALGRLQQRAREFHTEFYQIQPVYLHWRKTASDTPQYALIYDMNYVTETADYGSDPQADVTLTVEREPYWRIGVPPCDNPKRWTAIYRDVPYTVSFANLLSSTANQHVAYSTTIRNMHEWLTGSDPRTPLTVNYIDIPADAIPGDAPALVNISYQMTAGDASETFHIERIFIARSSKAPTVRRRDVDQQLRRFNTLNAADSGTGSPVADAGGPRRYSDNAQYRVDFDFSSGSVDEESLSFTAPNQFDGTRWRGKYHVYLRARQYNDTDQVVAYWRAGGETGARVPIEQFGTVAANAVQPVHDLGVVTLPTVGKTVVAPAGTGQATYTAVESSFAVVFERSGGTPIIAVYDVVLVPYDEGVIQIYQPRQSLEGLEETVWFAIGRNHHVMYDNTGYIRRGDADGIAIWYNATGNFSRYPELQGGELLLEPGVSNRLYFFVAGFLTNAASVEYPRSILPTTGTVRVNIVPRTRL